MVAFDCDKCIAFVHNNKKPDLVILRTKNNKYEWVVVEIKDKMDSKARVQIEAGLQTIANHVLFYVKGTLGHLGAAAHLKAGAHAADLQVLRKPLKIRGKAVPIIIRRCGDQRLI